MNVTINALHCSIPDRLRAAAFQRMERLARFHPRVADAHVTFNQGGFGREVEARVAVDGVPPLIAHADDDDFESALERVTQRLERQLKRRRQRVVRRPHHRDRPLPIVPEA